MFLARKHRSKEERMTAEAKIAQGKMTWQPEWLTGWSGE
jgi:lysyl-tRNA synthetase class I